MRRFFVQLCNPDTDNVYQMSLEQEKKTAKLDVRTKLIDELRQRIEALERLVKGTQTAWR